MPAKTVAPRIVIAEDEAIIRLDLKEMLQEEGFDVVGEASDGDAAIRLAEERRSDLVIMDIKMPGMDGLAAAERITDQGLGAVLILTAFSQKELVRRAARAGAMGYLVKPFQKSDLMPAIEIALVRHAELQAVRAESADLAERLDARKYIDRAKGYLADRRGMSEPEAFRFIQKKAMDERRPMKDVARDLVSG
ncbi:MAG: response regulator [Actinobacteria bacterium]|nr:response regulator [Actinomycetota bacterium]